jgi:methyl-accepting chemotaxis protein
MLDRLLSPVVDKEGITVRARALNLLALVTALVILVYTAVAFFTTPEEVAFPVGPILGVAFLLSLGCYWLGKRGRVQLAGHILFIGLFAAISLYLTNPSNTISDLTMALFLYVLVVLPAGYIIHPRVSFIAATLAVLYVILLMTLAPPPAYVAYEDQANYWSNAGLAFALYYILSAVAWVFSQGIDQALRQARLQNEELRRTAQELEAQRQLQEDTGRQILESAELLAEYSSSQARGASRQAAAIAQVSTSIEELEQAAREIAQIANSVAQAAQGTLKEAQRGQDIVWMNSEAMGVIHTNAHRGLEETAKLDEHLKQVSRVAAIISNLASQIQLVAFNATLEAAEAGEAGQRFGVVAAEVKDLASDSLDEAKHVDEIVHQVQEAGEVVVGLSGEQVQAVRSGTDMMNRSSAANQAIIGSAAGMVELAGQIQQTTAQQQEASGQVVSSVQEIKSVVDRWVVSSYQMDDLVDSLRTLAERLV